MIGNKNACFCKGGKALPLHEIAIPALLSLTFCPRQRLTRQLLEKTSFSTHRPVPRGRRPTPDSAVRPRAQNCLEYVIFDFDDDLG